MLNQIDSLELWAIDRLILNPNNAREHSEEQVDQIVASMQEFGWTIPVLADPEGNVIAGHGRLLAAEKLGIEEVPVILAEGWTDAQKRAYMLADNKLTLNGSWDYALLKSELQSLEEEFPDLLPVTGFSDEELDDLLADNEDLDPDDSGESTSGVRRSLLQFPGYKIEMSEEEEGRITDQVEQYIDAYGMSTGFVKWIMDKADA